jgi:hypothetical protein
LAVVVVDDPAIKDTADFFRLGLVTGLIDKPSVVAWADSVIEERQEIDPAIIDVCLAGSRPVGEMISMLRQVKGSMRPEVSLGMLLAYAAEIHRDRNERTGQIVLGLFRLTRMEDLPQDVEMKLHRLDDGLYLAREGYYGSKSSVTMALQDWLSEYSEYKRLLPISLIERLDDEKLG